MTRAQVLGGLAALIVLVSALSPPVPAAADELGTGDFPDPFVVLADGAYVAFGTSTRNGNGSLVRVPTLISEDLKTWTAVGDALVAPPVWASTRATLWAPAAMRVADGWRLYYSAHDVASGTRCISVASAMQATGPYRDTSSAPLVCDIDHGGAMDSEAFTDSKGDRWLLWKSEGRPGGDESRLWSQQLTDDGLALVGRPHLLLTRERPWESPVIENPSMIRRGGSFLLFYSGGNWRNSSYAVGYAVCDSPAGPCRRVRDTPLQASVGRYAGHGGQAVFVDHYGTMRLALHTWTHPKVGYDTGGARTMLVAAVSEGAALGVGASPVGRLDSATREGGALRVRGWALDRDVLGPIDVHIYVDRTGVAVSPAVHQRPDVEAAHRGWGGWHGYDVMVPLGPGPHLVCAYGINVGLGENRTLGCTRVA